MTQPDSPMPVVHFEIIGRNPARLRDFYRQLFGWQADAGAPVAAEVSNEGEYAFIDAIPAGEGSGIPGGIGGGGGFAPHAVFYVGVPDVAAALTQAESLGGRAVMGPARNVGGGVTVAHFEDPEGTLVGLAGLA